MTDRLDSTGTLTGDLLQAKAERDELRARVVQLEMHLNTSFRKYEELMTRVAKLQEGVTAEQLAQLQALLDARPQDMDFTTYVAKQAALLLPLVGALTEAREMLRVADEHFSGGPLALDDWWRRVRKLTWRTPMSGDPKEHDVRHKIAEALMVFGAERAGISTIRFGCDCDRCTHCIIQYKAYEAAEIAMRHFGLVGLP